MPERLVNRGWLDPEGDVTDAGRAARTEIEADTNARCAPMFSANLESERWHNSLCDLDAEPDGIVDRFGHLPVLDSRGPDQIVGYDEHGAPS